MTRKSDTRKYLVLSNVSIGSTQAVGHFNLIYAKDFVDCCIQYLKYLGYCDDIVEQGFKAFDMTDHTKIVAYANKFITVDSARIMDIVAEAYSATYFDNAEEIN